MLNKDKNFITRNHLTMERKTLDIEYFPNEVFVEYASQTTGTDIANKEHSITRDKDKVRLAVVLSRLDEKNILTSDFIFTNDSMEYSSGFRGQDRPVIHKIIGWIPDYLEQARKAPVTDEPEMLDD